MQSHEAREFPNDDEYLERLPNNIWLMDDHRWALLAWEREREISGNGRFQLIHADYHWDGVNDLQENAALELEVAGKPVDDSAALIKERNYVRYDSFIAPAVIRGLISEALFFASRTTALTEVLIQICWRGITQFSIFTQQKTR